jgi:hypothetical protein
MTHCEKKLQQGVKKIREKNGALVTAKKETDEEEIGEDVTKIEDKTAPGVH